MKPINLTNDLREQIALRLTAKASAKNAQKLGVKLEKLNAKFWDQHCTKVEKILKVDRKEWPGLIQLGILAATSTVWPERRDGDNVLALYKICVEGMRVEFLSAPELSGISSFLKNYKYSSSAGICFKIESAVPRLNLMETVESAQILLAADKLALELSNLFDAADEFYGSALAILYSCKTKKQLEEIFPEAAALVPTPAAPVKSIVPIEQAQSLRALLKTGIPAAEVQE